MVGLAAAACSGDDSEPSAAEYEEIVSVGHDGDTGDHGIEQDAEKGIEDAGGDGGGEDVTVLEDENIVAGAFGDEALFVEHDALVGAGDLIAEAGLAMTTGSSAPSGLSRMRWQTS